MAGERTTIITPKVGSDGYDISIEPPPNWSNFNVSRPTPRAARRYAESLRIVHGWRIRDLSGDGS